MKQAVQSKFTEIYNNKLWDKSLATLHRYSGSEKYQLIFQNLFIKLTTLVLTIILNLAWVCIVKEDLSKFEYSN